MRIADIAPDLRQAFDEAAGGGLQRLVTYCHDLGYEPHMFILTHLDGLPQGTMKLVIQAFQLPSSMGQHRDDIQDKTTVFFDCQLTGYAQILGWNFVLHEFTTAARRFIEQANAAIAQAGPQTAAERPQAEVAPETMLGLMEALRRSLNAGNRGPA